jgi:glycosyltransferase involved in cell wall biosynthesis
MAGAREVIGASADRFRVMHVLEPEPDGTIGGADTHVLTLAIQQRQSGRICPYVFINQNRSLARQLAENRINVCGSPDLAGSKVRSAVRLAAAVRLIRPSLLHSHGYDANFILAGACVCSRLIRDAPVVMTAHGWIEHYMKHRIKTVLDRLCHTLADGIILSSASQLSEMPILRRNPIVQVIENGVMDPGVPDQQKSTASAFVENLKESGQTVIACIGRLSAEKAWEVALYAFERARFSGQVSLVFVGCGPEESKLRKIARSLTCRRSVYFLGFAHDIQRVYRCTDILLHTSTTETSSRVTLESMSYSIPVVATRVGGIPDLVSHQQTGLLYASNDISGLAEGIKQLVADPGMRKRLGDAGHLRQRSLFALDDQERRIWEMYMRVIDNRASENGSVDEHIGPC